MTHIHNRFQNRRYKTKRKQQQMVMHHSPELTRMEENHNAGQNKLVLPDDHSVGSFHIESLHQHQQQPKQKQNTTPSPLSDNNFVDIETNEESGPGNGHCNAEFMELNSDHHQEASFTFCKNPFSQWFL